MQRKSDIISYEKDNKFYSFLVDEDEIDVENDLLSVKMIDNLYSRCCGIDVLTDEKELIEYVTDINDFIINKRYLYKDSNWHELIDGDYLLLSEIERDI